MILVSPGLPMEGLLSSVCFGMTCSRSAAVWLGSDWQILKSAYRRILDTALSASLGDTVLYLSPGLVFVVNNGVFSVYRLSPWLMGANQHPDP